MTPPRAPWRLGVTLLLASAASAQPVLRLEKSANAMGTVYSIVLYGSDREKMEAAADAALEEAGRLDALLSNYQPGSEWSQVNRGASSKPVKVSAELFRLLSACDAYSRASEGAFDISVGPLMKVWGFYKGTGSLPETGAVATARTSVGYRHIHLDADAQTVSFDRAGVESTLAVSARDTRWTAWSKS